MLSKYIAVWKILWNYQYLNCLLVFIDEGKPKLHSVSCCLVMWPTNVHSSVTARLRHPLHSFVAVFIVSSVVSKTDAVHTISYWALSVPSLFAALIVNVVLSNSYVKTERTLKTLGFRLIRLSLFYILLHSIPVAANVYPIVLLISAWWFFFISSISITSPL